MEVKIISCNKKIIAELAINIKVLEYYEGEFVINGLDGTAYSGSIDIGFEQAIPESENMKTCLNFYMYNVKSLKTEADLVGSIDSNTVCQTVFQFDNAKKWQCDNLIAMVCFAKIDGIISAVSGKITVEFEPTNKILMQENLVKRFSLLKGFEKTKPKDFSLKIKIKNFGLIKLAYLKSVKYSRICLKIFLQIKVLS